MSPGNPPPTPPASPHKFANEQLWKTYGVINEWIRFADAKAGALLTVNGVLLGAALNKVGSFMDFVSKHWDYWGALVVVLAVLCTISLLASAVFSLLCINPTLKFKTSVSDSPDNSTIYFEHIAAKSNATAFRQAVLGISDEEKAFVQIGDQVYSVSKVASTKHARINYSVLALFAGLILSVLLLVAVMVASAMPPILRGEI